MYLVLHDHFRKGIFTTTTSSSPPKVHRPISGSKRGKLNIAKHGRKKRGNTVRAANKSRQTHNRYVALHTRLSEADVRESDLIHKIADFLRKVLPDGMTSTSTYQKEKAPAKEPKFETIDLGTPTPKSTGRHYLKIVTRFLQRHPKGFLKRRNVPREAVVRTRTTTMITNMNLSTNTYARSVKGISVP
jgi:hypothetical protein